MPCKAINRITANAFLAVFLSTCGFAIQSSPSDPGVVVEKVTRASEADKSGITAGDVLLRWSGKDRNGQIDSPFDLLRIEVEEAPYSPIVMEGRHATETKRWSLGQQSWGLKVRPNFSEQALTRYGNAGAASTDGKAEMKADPKDMLVKWRSFADDTRLQGAPAWMTSWIMLRAAEAMGDGKNWDLADDACQSALAAAKEAPYALTLLKACSEVFFLREKGEVRALKYLQLALAKSQKENPRSLTTAVLLSNVGRLQEDFRQAIDLMVQAINLQEQLVPGSLALAYNENRVGTFYQNSGDLENARKYMRRALEIREKLAPESKLLAQSLENLGNIHTIAGDTSEAVAVQTRACAMWERLEPASLSVAGCFVDAGSAEQDRGDLAAAEGFFKRAFDIQRNLSPRGVGAGSSLNNLGSVQQERGQLVEAEESFRQAYSIFQEVEPDSLLSAIPMANLGMIDTEVGNLDQAEDYLVKVQALREKLSPDSFDLGETYNYLGDLALKRGDSGKAQVYYAKGLATLQASVPNSYEPGDSLQGLGQAFEKSGNLGAAEENYNKALQIWARLIPGSAKHAQTLMAMADLKRRSGQFKASEDFFNQAANAIDHQASRLGGGEQTLAQFRAMFEDGYKNQVELLISLGRQEDAFQLVERLHARTLLETLSAARVEIKSGGQNSLLIRERNLETEISSKSNARLHLLQDEHTLAQAGLLEAEIKELLERHSVVQEEIRQVNPVYAALTQPKPSNVTDAQHLLDEHSVLLEYSLGEDRSYVFVVTPAAIQTVELPRRSEIEKQARLVHNLLTDRNRTNKDETETQRARRWAESAKAYDLASSRLSSMILEPVAKHLAGKRVLVVADGALHYVPFAALPDPSATGGSPLVVLHEIVNLPSASVLALLRHQAHERKPGSKAVAIFADPVFDDKDPRVSPSPTSAVAASHGLQSTEKPEVTLGSGTATHGNAVTAKPASPSLSASLLTRSAGDLGLDRNGQLALPRLRYTRQEADAISAVAPRATTLEATDFRATRATAISPELASYRIIHFATHGLLNSQHPELSGLVFSLVDKNGKSQDGFLTLQDIYNLNLPADLVVLSACETGLGKEISGEGLIGLTRGFMYAGATRVVASLWNVSDVATARLMADFYRSMEKDSLPPAAALRAAQIKMLQQKRWASPYYWAAFQLQGEWK